MMESVIIEIEDIMGKSMCRAHVLIIVFLLYFGSPADHFRVT